ncbi:MAG: hypothetical protein KGZ86_01330 [Candidatus Latescibacteria bacterium]|nr:hypothetical protein [Candidatus Latescibacterota bacterium]
MNKLFEPNMFGRTTREGETWWRELFSRAEDKEGAVFAQLHGVYTNGDLTSNYQGGQRTESFSGGYLYYKDDLNLIQKTTQFKEENEARACIPKIRIELKEKGLFIAFRIEAYSMKESMRAWELMKTELKNNLDVIENIPENKILGKYIDKDILLAVSKNVISSNILSILKEFEPLFEEWRKIWKNELSK